MQRAQNTNYCRIFVQCILVCNKIIINNSNKTQKFTMYMESIIHSHAFVLLMGSKLVNLYLNFRLWSWPRRPLSVRYRTGAPRVWHPRHGSHVSSMGWRNSTLEQRRLCGKSKLHDKKCSARQNCMIRNFMCISCIKINFRSISFSFCLSVYMLTLAYY